MTSRVIREAIIFFRWTIMFFCLDHKHSSLPGKALRAHDGKPTHQPWWDAFQAQKTTRVGHVSCCHLSKTVGSAKQEKELAGEILARTDPSPHPSPGQCRLPPTFRASPSAREAASISLAQPCCQPSARIQGLSLSSAQHIPPVYGISRKRIARIH
jgi:hypothetical protein